MIGEKSAKTPLPVDMLFHQHELLLHWQNGTLGSSPLFGSPIDLLLGDALKWKCACKQVLCVYFKGPLLDESHLLKNSVCSSYKFSLMGRKGLEKPVK